MPHYAQLNLDSVHWSGWRAFLCYRTGRKFAYLIATDDATPLTLPLAEYQRALRTERPLPFKKTRLARRLRATARTFGTSESRAIRDALACLANA